MAGTVSMSGLVSNTNWTQLIQDMINAEKAAVVNPLTNKKNGYSSKLSAWQSFNTTLRSLQNYIETTKLHEDAGYNVYTSSLTASGSVAASDILSVTVGSTAGPGTHTVETTQLAEAERFSSGIFASKTAELGGTGGDVVVNGKAVSIAATDTLLDVVSKINNANSGATASIISTSSTEHRLIIESNSAGAHVLSLQNGSSVDVLAGILQLHAGNTPADEQFAHALTDGSHGSDAFTNSTSDIKTLLGLATGESGSVTIQGQSVSIDLSADSLDSIAAKINTAVGEGTASVEAVTNSLGSTTGYRLKLASSVNYGDVADDRNILEAIGLVEGKRLNPLATDGGLDAALKIDGYAMTSPTNTVSDAITGLTLTLKKANTGSPVTLQVAYDNSALTGKVSAMVTSVNSVLSAIKAQNTYTSSGSSGSGTAGGALFGDVTLTTVQNMIRSASFTEVTENSTYKTLSSIGITFGSAGTLSVDTTKLTSALTANRGEVENVLKAVSDTLYDNLDVYVDPLTGTLTSIENSIQNRVSDIDKRLTALDEKYEKKTEALEKKYNALEVLMAKSTSIRNWLTQQVEAMNSYNS